MTECNHSTTEALQLELAAARASTEAWRYEARLFSKQLAEERKRNAGLEEDTVILTEAMFPHLRPNCGAADVTHLAFMHNEKRDQTRLLKIKAADFREAFRIANAEGRARSPQWTCGSVRALLKEDGSAAAYQQAVQLEGRAARAAALLRHYAASAPKYIARVLNEILDVLEPNDAPAAPSMHVSREVEPQPAAANQDAQPDVSEVQCGEARPECCAAADCCCDDSVERCDLSIAIAQCLPSVVASLEKIAESMLMEARNNAPISCIDSMAALKALNPSPPPSASQDRKCPACQA